MSNNLYLIGRSPAEDPFTRSLFDTILVLAKNGATGLHVHLLQDGVLAARKEGTWVSRILQMLDQGIIDAIFAAERICSDI